MLFFSIYGKLENCALGLNISLIDIVFFRERLQCVEVL